MKKTILNNEKGFALLAAIIASMIILAVGLLALNYSVGDLGASRLSIGDRKALAATESGIHTLAQEFIDDPTTWTSTSQYTQDCTSVVPNYIWRSIASGVDANTEFAICVPTRLNAALIQVPGYALDEAALMRYTATVVGRNSTYKTKRIVMIGIGYGPVMTKQ